MNALHSDFEGSPASVSPKPNMRTIDGRRRRPASRASSRSRAGATVSRRPRLDPNTRSARPRLVAMSTERASIRRFLARRGEVVDVPERSPSRGPPYWKSVVMRRKATGDGERE